MFFRGYNGAKDAAILKWTFTDFESLLRVGIDIKEFPAAGIVEATDGIPPCCKTGFRFPERELHSVSISGMIIFGKEDGTVAAESNEVSMDKGTNMSRGRVGRRGGMRYCGILPGDAGSTGTVYI